MNALIKLAALAGFAWLVKQPAAPATTTPPTQDFVVGARVRVVGYGYGWDGTTGVLTEENDHSWSLKADAEGKEVKVGVRKGEQLSFAQRHLEVINS